MKATEHPSFQRALGQVRKGRRGDLEPLILEMESSVAAGGEDMSAATALEEQSGQLFREAVGMLYGDGTDALEISYELPGRVFAVELLVSALSEGGGGGSIDEVLEQSLAKIDGKVPETVAVCSRFVLREDYCMFGYTSLSPEGGSWGNLREALEVVLIGTAHEIAKLKLAQNNVPPVAASILAPHVALMIEPLMSAVVSRALPDGADSAFAGFSVEVAKKLEAMDSVSVGPANGTALSMTGAEASAWLIQQADAANKQLEEVGALSKFFGSLGV